jgi:hypothetical protein
VDEKFIAASLFQQFTTRGNTLFFISSKTLEVSASLSLECDYVYNRGLLFQSRGNGIVRILDVATGRHFDDVHLSFWNETGRPIEFIKTWVSSNSRFMVIGWKYSTMFGTYSHLSVYDLEAIKKPNSHPGCYLLYTLQYKFDIEKFVMNDSEMAFVGKHRSDYRSVTVLKFADFNFAKRKSSELKENSINQKMPIKASLSKMKIPLVLVLIFFLVIIGINY